MRKWFGRKFPSEPTEGMAERIRNPKIDPRPGDVFAASAYSLKILRVTFDFNGFHSLVGEISVNGDSEYRPQERSFSWQSWPTFIASDRISVVSRVLRGEG